MAFHFRQFDVEDAHSTMRVGTDAMMLGSWAEPGKAMRILDVGTGCGVLALMMAQKSAATISTIDIDPESVTEAQNNFNRCLWRDRLFAIHQSLRDFALGPGQGCDFIIANPPWFSNSLKSPSDRKNNTRHDQSLSFELLVADVVKILTREGVFILILPAVMAGEFIETARMKGLYLRRRMQVRPKPEAPALRTLMEFSRDECNTPGKITLAIRDETGAFSVEYLALTNGFHNF